MLSAEVGFTNIPRSVVIALHNGMYKKQYHNHFPIMVDVVAPDSGYSTLRKHTEHRLSCAVELFGICKLFNLVVESSTRARNWLKVRVGVLTCTIVVSVAWFRELNPTINGAK